MAEIVFSIGGEAGQGVESSGAGFARALARHYHVFGVADYESRIRGGHNSYHVRAADTAVRAPGDRVHVMVGLDGDASRVEHAGELAPGAAFVYDDARRDVNETELLAAGARVVAAPLERIATETGGSKIMANTAALGVAAGLIHLDFDSMAAVIRANFGGKKGAEVGEKNVAVAQAALEWARANHADFPYRLPAPLDLPPRVLVNGNEAFALGALAAGCQFISGYPMTPWSTAFQYLIEAARRDAGIVAHQVEDEIAAISAALGAAWGGARAMTGSSGGGFDLMVEHVSLAGMNEVPIVILLVQRGGPGTGMPTRTEQSDLLTVIGAGHGEFPRVVLAAADVQDCFDLAARAFNLAERYQTPVIVMSDLHLSHLVYDLEPGAFDPARAGIDRGKTLTHADLDALQGPYRRYEITADGISPRAIPGHRNALVHGMSDEHTETGAITESAANRVAMVDKRARKLEGARREARPPELYGDAGAPVTLLGWGSTLMALREAVDRLGGQVNLVHLRDLQPWPESATEALARARRLVAVEQNATAQLARLAQMECGAAVADAILKYDGRPFTAEWVVRQLRARGLARPEGSEVKA